MAYVFKQKTKIVYPSDAFDEFECIMSWELATIIAESNSWKTTFALDMISKNADRWIKGYYINLEFAIETMRQSRWLRINNKTKSALAWWLTDEEIRSMEDYINKMLSKFQYYNQPNWIDLRKLEQIIEIQSIAWYKLFVIDTFSKIHWNLDSQTARSSQNKCMEELQELAQRLDVAIVILHHTNRAWTREWSQKIMDLSNVFLVITKQEDANGEEYRTYELLKDKYVSNKKIDVYYHGGRYERF